MPAKYVKRETVKESYSHVFNSGIEGKSIFVDADDYAVFTSYLKDYLSSPPDLESTKKTFMIRGRTFKGSGHQPKNYFGKVELVAYDLMPDKFDLLLHQKESGAVEKFIRSLCTRYSIYFNKKYKRIGTLFAGPYKSVAIANDADLINLTYSFHRNINNSSYLEYVGKRVTSWVKTKKAEGSYSEDAYKANLGKETIASEPKVQPVTQRVVDSVETKNQEYVKAEEPTHARRDLTSSLEEKVRVRTTHFMAAVGMFLILFTLGIKNINSVAAKTENANSSISSIPSAPSATPSVAGVSTEALISTPSATPDVSTTASKPEDVAPVDAGPAKVFVKVKITDGVKSVNVRSEASITSAKIDDAFDGDKFELISNDTKWYQVKLVDGSTGFISSRYIDPTTITEGGPAW